MSVYATAYERRTFTTNRELDDYCRGYRLRLKVYRLEELRVKSAGKSDDWWNGVLDAEKDLSEWPARDLKEAIDAWQRRWAR